MTYLIFTKFNRFRFVGMKMKVKLTDLCNIQYGYAFDSGNFTDDESFIPLVRIRDVKKGFSEKPILRSRVEMSMSFKTGIC